MLTPYIDWPLPDVDPYLFTPTEREFLRHMVVASPEPVWFRVKGKDIKQKHMHVLACLVRRKLAQQAPGKERCIVTTYRSGYRWLP